MKHTSLERYIFRVNETGSEFSTKLLLSILFTETQQKYCFCKNNCSFWASYFNMLNAITE